MHIERLETIRLNCGEGIYCDITPSIEDPNTYDFWLHKKGTGESLYMFSLPLSSTEEAVDVALANVPDHKRYLVQDEAE